MTQELLFIDTEFNDFRGELISIAIVDNHGREFYEVLPQPRKGYSPWVAQHVVPVLNKEPIGLEQVRLRLGRFLSQYRCPHLVADWPEDIEHFLRLLIVGPGERIGPDRWTMEVRRDLPNTADTSIIPHNALEDARALRRAALSSGPSPSTSRPATAELDKTAPYSETTPRDHNRGVGEKGQACRSPEGERHDIHPGSARPLNDAQPDGWAVVAGDGHFVGIWQAREIADKVVNRSPSVKGERVRGMVFASREGDPA
jgi:hypothetical protein